MEGFDPHWRGANMAVPVAMLVYAAAAAALCWTVGHPADFRIDLYIAPFYVSFVVYGMMIGGALLVRRSLGRDNKHLLWFERTFPLDEFTHRLISALPFLLMWPIFMSGFTSIKNLLDDTLPFTWDSELMALGRDLHFGKHLWEWLPIESRPVTLTLEFLYAFWGVLLVAVPFSVSLRRPDCPKRTQFLVSHVLVLVLLGNVVAGFFMSAGPFSIEFSGHLHHPYARLFDYLIRTDPDGSFSAVTYQRYLWEARQHRDTWFGTGISAFPSIHVAVAMLYVLFGWQFGRLARVASILFLVAIMVGSVHLGWHYALDGYAGMAGAGAIYFSVGWAQRRLGNAASGASLRTQPLPARA
jgi:hypothetical protein